MTTSREFTDELINVIDNMMGGPDEVGDVLDYVYAAENSVDVTLRGGERVNVKVTEL